jgi:hypothetical protein
VPITSKRVESFLQGRFFRIGAQGITLAG